MSLLKVRDFPAEDLLHAHFDSPAVQQLQAVVASADGLVVGTPVYKASFTGALKVLLDLLPERALAHKVVLPWPVAAARRICWRWTTPSSRCWPR